MNMKKHAPEISILIVGAIGYLIDLGLHPIAADESIYTTISRQMVTEGYWLIPHLPNHPAIVDGVIFLEKPPLVFWFQAVSMAIFGPSLVAARFPSVLASLVLAVVVYRMGRSLYSERVGIASGFVFLVVPAVYWHSHAGRTATTDIFLLLFGALFVWLLWEGRSRPRLVVWAGVAGGLAVMSKQVAAVQFLLVALPLLAVYRNEYSLPALGKGIAAGLIVIVPWNLYAYLSFPDLYLNQMIIEQVLSRGSGSSTLINMYFLRRWPYYIGPFLLPASIGIASVAVTAYRERASVKAHAGLLLVWWLVVPIALFSLVTSTTLIHYLLPTAVPIALLSGLAAVRVTALFERVISERWRETYISSDVYTILGALITLALFAVYPAHQAIRASGMS